MCDLPPCPPCPPPPAPPCPQVCPPDPLPQQRVKPIMRGLHWKQTMRHVYIGLGLSSLAGALVYTFLGQRRREAYRTFYQYAELDDWADEMARKGLFQAVPKDAK